MWLRDCYFELEVGEWMDMAVLDVNKLKMGVTFLDDDGQPYKVMSFDFHKMGRGKANIKIRARNLVTGAIVIKSYLSGGRVESVELTKREMQYLYNDGRVAYFMHPKTFEQAEIELEILGDDINFLVEGENAWVINWEERILGVEIPASVEMKVTETEPWIKGNSATNVYKPAKVESGLTVQVPLFIKEGDRIKINTSTGSYVARVN